MARRGFLLLALLLAAWAAAVLVTGGGVFAIGPIRLSSRSAGNPSLLALIALAAAWLAAPAGGRTRAVVADLGAAVRTCVSNASWIVAGAATVAVVAIGFSEGAFVAGGADSYGYLSQGRTWAAGRLTIDEPLMREMRPVVQPEAWAPLGYIPARDGPSIVPIYSPGLPMVMALFARAGGDRAMFAVVPIMAGVLVWTAFLLGRRVAGADVGAAAAVLMASSPTFLFQLTTAPMSDIPVAAWWTICLVLLGGAGSGRAFLSGIAAGLALLTRPNLAPAALVPFALLLVTRAEPDTRAGRVRNAALFALGAAPACLIVAALNAYWYGSPVSSGYGPLAGMYRPEYLLPNLRLYPEWLIASQTPVILLSLAAPFVSAWLPRESGALPSRLSPASLLWFAAAIVACYLFYFPFNIWWYLRFLLPAFPALFITTSMTMAAIAMKWGGRLRRPAIAVVVGLVAWHGLRYAQAASAFDTQTDLKYEVIGQYVAQRLTERSVIIARMHSGSARYYSGRPTLRFDYIEPAGLDALVDRLMAAGLHPYLLLEQEEQAAFRDRFQAKSRLGSLDWPALARLPLGDIRIFDAALTADAKGNGTVTEIIR